jgi:class 3 adenylate cyclase
MSTLWDEKQERRKYQIPNTPGNYPANLISIMNKTRNNPNFLNEIHIPKEKFGIVLASDIRNFTETMKNNDHFHVQSFLTYFFNRATELIHNHGGYVNKFLGDGLLAHFDNSKEFEAIEVSEEMQRIFIGLRGEYHLNSCNLSVSLSKSEYVETTIGKNNYIDFTLIGADINQLFRLLSSTEGRLNYVTSNYINSLNKSHHYVFVGTKKFKGIIEPIPCYSIIRTKTTKEKETNIFLECNKEFCPDLYNICYAAWEFGRSDRVLGDPHEYIFTLDCNICGKEKNKCWNWDNCKQKYINAYNHNPALCCHICSNYRNCFHSYQLGRQGHNMITCNKDLLKLS